MSARTHLPALAHVPGGRSVGMMRGTRVRVPLLTPTAPRHGLGHFLAQHPGGTSGRAEPGRIQDRPVLPAPPAGAPVTLP